MVQTESEAHDAVEKQVLAVGMGMKCQLGRPIIVNNLYLNSRAQRGIVIRMIITIITRTKLNDDAYRANLISF